MRILSSATALFLLLAAAPSTAFVSRPSSSDSLLHIQTLRSPSLKKTNDVPSKVPLFPTSTATSSSTQLFSSVGVGVARPLVTPLIRALAAVLVASVWAAYKLVLRGKVGGFSTTKNRRSDVPKLSKCPLFQLTGQHEKHLLVRWVDRLRGKRPVVSLVGADIIRKVNNLEFVQTVSQNKLDTDDDQENLFAKYGLQTTDGNRHDYLRRLLAQTMTPEALREAVPTLQKVAQSTLEESIAGPSLFMPHTFSVSMHDVSTDYALDVAQRQLLGLQLEYEEIPVMREILRKYVHEEESSSRVQTYLIKTIRKQMKRLKKKKRTGKLSSTLAKLILAREQTDFKIQSLTNSEIVVNALHMIQSGTEPTAGMLTYAIFLLGLHPDVYQQLVSEQRRLQQQHGFALTCDLLGEHNSPYLHGIVQETLRMGCPTSGGKQQLVMEDIDMGEGFGAIPKGYLVESNYRQTHHLDPSMEHDSMDPHTGFHPERWMSTTMSSSTAKKNKPEEFMPFGIGPRTCMGQAMAELQLKVFLAMWARRIASYQVVANNHNLQVQQRDGKSRTHNKKIEWASNTLIPRPKDGVKIDNIEVVSSSSTMPPPTLESCQETVVTEGWLKEALETSPTSFA